METEPKWQYKYVLNVYATFTSRFTVSYSETKTTYPLSAAG